MCYIVKTAFLMTVFSKLKFWPYLTHCPFNQTTHITKYVPQLHDFLLVPMVEQQIPADTVFSVSQHLQLLLPSNIKLLKWEWHCCRDALPTVSCQQMPIRAVMNDKKTSHCRGTARVKFNFLYHVLSRRAFWDTEDYGSSPHSPPAAVLGEGVCRGGSERLRPFQQLSDRSTALVYPAEGV